MTQLDVLSEVLGRLSEIGIPYALTGSYASTYGGQPRSTHDIDFVAMVSGDTGAALAEAMGPDYYAGPDMAREAPGCTEHFNFIHLDTGIKIDFWVVGTGAYERGRFARRVAPEPTQPLLVVLTAEDVIPSKLQWMHMGAGGRHRDDVTGILRLRGADVDVEYMRRWATELGVAEDLETALVSLDELKVLERLEDEELIRLADESESEPGPDIPWEQVKGESESSP